MSDLATRLIHHPYRPPDGFEAVAPGVHKASTVIFPNVQALRTQEWKDKSGYTYGLHGTPTSFILEERIATVEGGLFCALVCPAAFLRWRWLTWLFCVRVTSC
jgi:cystathionine beta-lyase